MNKKIVKIIMKKSLKSVIQIKLVLIFLNIELIFPCPPLPIAVFLFSYTCALQLCPLSLFESISNIVLECNNSKSVIFPSPFPHPMPAIITSSCNH